MVSLFWLVLPMLAMSQYTPLASRRIPFDEIPSKVDTVASGRGPQSGINRCNATTEGPDSQCQTAHFNSLTEFCLWGLPEPNSTIGNSEAASVAWCTTPGFGTRVIPAGAITGAQFIQTDEYIQVTGQIDQTKINIAADDAGGEMDPAGEDKRGNPLGGLMYTTAFGNGTRQVIWWTNFLGANIFCLKACRPGSPNEARNCEHVYDRVGCLVNIPSNGYKATTFETCKGDVALPVGVYIDGSGSTKTWYQPGVDTPIGELPYNASSLIPASSSCSVPSSLPAAMGSAPASSGSGVSATPTESTIATASGAIATDVASPSDGQQNVRQSSAAEKLGIPSAAALFLSAAFLAFSH